MAVTLKSLSNDSIILGISEKGVLVAVVPAEPSSDGILDLFQGSIRFTNVARAIKALVSGGTFSTDDESFKIIGNQHHCTLAFEFNHAPGEWFECQLNFAACDQLHAFLREALEGKTVVSPNMEEATTKGVKVGRNEECPCGSGKKYKKCCMRSEHGFKVQLPTELVALKDTFDGLVAVLTKDFLADPRVTNDPDFWHAVAMAGGQNNNHEVAISSFRKAIKLKPGDPVLISNLAVHLAQVGNASEALALLNSLPDNTNRKAVITANILQDLNRHEEAIPLYERAIREEPDFFLPYARILNSLKATQSVQYDLWLERGIRALPENPTLARYFVDRCLEQDRFDELANAEWIENLASEAGRTDMLGRNEDDPKLIIECQLKYFAVRILRDRDAELLNKARQVLDGVPSHWHFCGPAKHLLSVSAKMGSADGVRIAFNRICKGCVSERIGLEADLAGYLAVANTQSGNYVEAKRHCEDSLSRHADNTMVLFTHWRVLDELGETESAVNQAEKLYKLKPELDSLCYNLGYLCGKDGQIGKSIYYYREEVSKTPDNYRAFENLCFAQILQHELEAARASYQAYRQMVDSQHEPFEDDSSVSVGEFDDALQTEGIFISNETMLEAKDRKFESLIKLATENAGSPSLILDLIHANNSSLPVIGAFTAIRPEYLTDARILEGIIGPPAIREEVEFHLKARNRGDASFAFASIERDLPNWSELPRTAISSLVEAERIFLSGVSVDSAPYIVAYAKAVEIYLHEVVFRSFREKAKTSFSIGQSVRDVLQDGKDNKAFALAKFVDTGSALTLGTMNFFLPLCNGKSVAKIPLLGKLKDHIVSQLEIPVLLEQPTIDDLKNLVDVYRNKAAHEKRFSHEECKGTRDLVFKLLRRVALPSRD